MIEFLRKILLLARPYRSRLILGILCGVASGLSSALLMGSVKIVVDTVFTDRESAEIHVIRNIKVNHDKRLKSLIKENKTSEFELERKKNLQLDEALASLKTLSSNAPPELEIYTNLTAQWSQHYEEDLKEKRDSLAKDEKAEVTELNKLAASAKSAKSPRTPLWLKPYVEKIQSLLPESDTIKKNKAATVFIILLVPLAMLIRVTAMYLNIYLMNWVSIRAVTDLRNKLFAHLVHLDLSFFNKASTGELITRLNDVAVIQGTIGNSLSVIIRAPVTIIALGANLIYQQPKLTMVAFTVFPLCILPVVYYGRKAGKATELFQSKAIGLGKLMHETFTGNRIIKAYNLENTVINQFSKTSSEYIGFFMRMIRGSELPGPMIEFAGSLGIAIFFMYIAFTGAQTPGDFLSFVGSLFLMYQPIKEMTRLHTQLDHARVLSDGIFKLLDTKTTVPEAVNPVPLNANDPHIVFKDVTFSYDPKNKPVLIKFNLTIKPGQMVALVGTTGSGKTTVTNLLLRFYDSQSGSITINGVDITQVKLTDLRRQIAVVTQDTILFNESILHNIELGRPGASRKEVEEAARHAHAYDFIMSKEHGFESQVGEKGAMLSGGQKQRITIARAIVKNAPILILDEATNSLDAEVERIVQDALEELMVGRTTICIAHRLASTTPNADVIIVMADGQIVEMGKHHELLALNGHYKRLWDMQFQTQSAS